MAIMRLRNPVSAKIAAFFPFSFVATIYHWYASRNLWRQFPYFKQTEFAPDKIIGLVLCLVAAGFFLWHAFKRQATGDDRRLVTFALGVGALILAVVLTLEGLGYEHHTLKILIVTLMYLAAALFLWRAYKGHPLTRNHG